MDLQLRDTGRGHIDVLLLLLLLLLVLFAGCIVSDILAAVSLCPRDGFAQTVLPLSVLNFKLSVSPRHSI